MKKMKMAYVVGGGESAREIAENYFVFLSNLPPHPHLATFVHREPCEIRVRADFGRCNLGGETGGAAETRCRWLPGPAASESTAHVPDRTGVGAGAPLSDIRAAGMGQ